ncbi:MAG: hypothetical protein J1E00_08275 [Oscillospiraceae bacterium]|nr:hypothetical protein [Oscillospiraceae bacterium]
MKHLVFKRLFVGVLSATLFLTACATTVPSEESREVGEGGAADHSHTLPMENLGAVQDESQASDPQVSESQVSEAERPVVLPQERETELELVTSFKTGEDGLFPYFFYWAESGPEHAAYKTTRAECADDKGNVYVVLTAKGYSGDICRLNDGKMYVRGAGNTPISMLYSKGLLYLWLEDSYVETIDVESGERTTIAPSAYLEEHTGDFRFVSSNGEEPIWLRYDGKERYSLDGEALPVEGYPRTVVRTDESTGNGILTGQNVNQVLSLDGDSAGGEWSVKYEDAEKLLCVASRDNRFITNQPYNVVWEEIYCLYDQNGNITSKFKHTMIRYDEQPCSFPFTQFGDAYVLEAYNPLKVTVDDYTFENVFDYKKIYGSNGTMYLLLYYFDHGEVYRILPGYENATFSKLTEAEANEVAVSSESLQATASHSGHTYYPMDTVFSRAQEMTQIKWNLSEENIKRLTNTKRPTYIDEIVTANGGKANNASMVGIPYCWGGFNGLDTNGTSENHIKFVDVIVRTGIMAGNIKAVYNDQGVGFHVDHTGGLDCSGYVSAAFGLTTKKGTSTILEYCDKVSEPQKGDLLNKSGSHVILIYEVKKGGPYTIYECSAEDVEKTKKRVITQDEFDEYVDVKNYEIYRPAYLSMKYSSNSASHWRVCTICGQQFQTESHTISSSYSKDEMSHWKACTVCQRQTQIGPHKMTANNLYCTVCGYVPVLGVFPPVESTGSDDDVSFSFVELCAVAEDRRGQA